ncbi:hypothetical protein CBOM_05997 [Ceraceosorus bombacis]|uniref:Uncharacterized protein n=1 Tax=Ceraceosorus bombacis TaxID=401625 RepID=A0A0P1BJ34_9BASI|nr:hypothetical protein CBOM_05997 [Ceraceosorus bombacis]
MGLQSRIKRWVFKSTKPAVEEKGPPGRTLLPRQQSLNVLQASLIKIVLRASTSLAERQSYSLKAQSSPHFLQPLRGQLAPSQHLATPLRKLKNLAQRSLLSSR